MSTGTWMYAGTAIRRTRERRFKQRIAHDSDERSPHLRLVPLPDDSVIATVFAPDPIIETSTLPAFPLPAFPLPAFPLPAEDLAEVPVQEPAPASRFHTNELVFVQVLREQSWKAYGIKLHPIRARPQRSFAFRETTCPYLEDTSQHRRCMAQDPKQITLKCQAAYCLGPRHRRCAYYRQARGFPTIPPERLAAYTVAIALVIVLTITAGFLAVTNGDSAVAGSHSNSQSTTNHP